MTDERQEAARRLGLPGCTTCGKVTSLEEISFGEEDRGQIFYLGGFYCAPCAVDLREWHAKCKTTEEVKKTFDMKASMRFIGGNGVEFEYFFGPGKHVWKGPKS